MVPNWSFLHEEICGFMVLFLQEFCISPTFFLVNCCRFCLHDESEKSRLSILHFCWALQYCGKWRPLMTRAPANTQTRNTCLASSAGDCVTLLQFSRQIVTKRFVGILQQSSNWSFCKFSFFSGTFNKTFLLLTSISLWNASLSPFFLLLLVHRSLICRLSWISVDQQVTDPLLCKTCAPLMEAPMREASNWRNQWQRGRHLPSLYL